MTFKDQLLETHGSGNQPLVSNQEFSTTFTLKVEQTGTILEGNLLQDIECYNSVALHDLRIEVI